MTTGEMFFWGGLVGMAFFALAGIVSWIVLRSRGKRLLKSIEREYQ